MVVNFPICSWKCWNIKHYTKWVLGYFLLFYVLFINSLPRNEEHCAFATNFSCCCVDCFFPKFNRKTHWRFGQICKMYIVHIDLWQAWCKKAKLQAGIKPTALCSAIDKENLIEFPLDFLHYLYNYIVCELSSYAYHVTNHMTSCDVTLWLPVMWLWLCNTFPHFLLCSKSKIKEKEKKRNANNDLTILPSHDTTLLLGFLVLRNFLQLIVWVSYITHFVIIFFCPFSNSWIFFLDFFFLCNCFYFSFPWLPFFSLSPIPFQPFPIFLIVPFI